jgi:hypothetical protein
MTTARKKEILSESFSIFIRNWLPVLITALAGGVAFGELQSDLIHNSKDDAVHHSNPELHMPFAEKMRFFATRDETVRLLNEIREIDQRQREILNILSRIDEHYKSINKNQ